MRRIDADELEDRFAKSYFALGGDRPSSDMILMHRAIRRDIKNCPTVEEEAEWISCGVWSRGIGMGEVYGDKVRCSSCMTEFHFYHKYCPECGRRMKNANY